MDIIIAFICCYQLHRQAHEKGLPPWPYIGQFVAGFVAIGIVLGVAIVSIWGADFLQNEDTLKKATMLSPFAILFEVILYIIIRKRIQKVQVEYEDDEPTPPRPSKDKPDLSYFR